MAQNVSMRQKGTTSPVFNINATTVTEGMKKNISKIPLPVDPTAQEESGTPAPQTDRLLFLDLLKITNDISITGWIAPNDMEGGGISWDVNAIKQELKDWMRSGALVSLKYRTAGFTYGSEGRNNPGESWIVEDIQFIDDDTETELAGGDVQIGEIKVTIKLIYGELIQTSDLI